MLTGKPVVPVSFEAEAAMDSVKEHIRAQGWRRVNTSPPKLLLVPYYFFQFTVFFEETHKDKGHKVLVDSETGSLAISAVDGEIDEAVAGIIDENIESLTHEISEDTVRLERARIPRKDAEKIAQIKTAELKEVERKNTLVSNVQLVLVPQWDVHVKSEEHEFDFLVSGVSGEILGGPDVPERGKNFSELAEETVGDLRHPHAWLEYFKGLAETIWNILTWRPFWDFVFAVVGMAWRAVSSNRVVQVLLLVLILLWILFGGN